VKKEMAVAYLLLISYDNTVWKAGIQFKIWRWSSLYKERKILTTQPILCKKNSFCITWKIYTQESVVVMFSLVLFLFCHQFIQDEICYYYAWISLINGLQDMKNRWFNIPALTSLSTYNILLWTVVKPPCCP
jgi:hypothetical protein